MKTFLSRPGYLLTVMLASLFYVSCSDPEEEINTTTQQKEEEKEEEEVTTADADAFLESLGFTSSSKIVGSTPTVANTSLVKTDSKDTIYTMPGLTMPIRISHPQAVALQGVYVAARNATFYLDVPIDQEEDSDTVSVILIKFPETEDFPTDVPVEIIPYDQSKNPVDIIERIITIEAPEDSNSGGCNFLKDGDTTSIGPPEWTWHYTVVFDHNGEVKFLNAPGRVFAATQEPTGCCSFACPTPKRDPITNVITYVDDSKVTANTSYSIDFEFFTFFKDGTFRRATLENITNFNPATTDWCAKIPGYNIRESHVDYYGTHDYVPGDNNISYVTLRSVCDDPNGICGYGSRPGDLTFSCHTMTITVDKSAFEGTKEERMYRRHSASLVFND